MDTVEFYREFRRMCIACESVACKNCPMDETLGICDLAPLDFTDEIIESAIKVVEKWARDHPVITNAKKFEEVFGPVNKIEMSTTTTSISTKDPQPYNNIKVDKYLAIYEDWWNQEYKEP